MFYNSTHMPLHDSNELNPIFQILIAINDYKTPKNGVWTFFKAPTEFRHLSSPWDSIDVPRQQSNNIYLQFYFTPRNLVWCYIWWDWQAPFRYVQLLLNIKSNSDCGWIGCTLNYTTTVCSRIQVGGTLLRNQNKRGNLVKWFQNLKKNLHVLRCLSFTKKSSQTIACF